MPKYLSTILKFLITLLALFFVLSRVDLEQIGGSLAQADPIWLLIGFLLCNSSLVVRAYRWRLLLQSLKSSISFGRLVELYFVGNFFNVVLPSGFGGDVVRAIEAAQDMPSGIAAGTVLIDRLTGLMVLFMLALVALPFRPPIFSPTLLLLLTAVSLFGLIAGFVVLDGRLLTHLNRFLPPGIRSRLAEMVTAVHQCGWRAIFAALFISLLFNFMQVGWWVAAGYALSLNVSFFHYLLILPVMSLSLLVPSIGGLGVRESLAPTLLASSNGISPEQAISLTLLVFAIERLSGLLGAPVYLVSLLKNKQE